MKNINEISIEQIYLAKEKFESKLDAFTWAVKYEDMLIFKKYIKKHPDKFSNILNQHVKVNP